MHNRTDLSDLNDRAGQTDLNNLTDIHRIRTHAHTHPLPHTHTRKKKKGETKKRNNRMPDARTRPYTERTDT